MQRFTNLVFFLTYQYNNKPMLLSGGSNPELLAPDDLHVST
jgi:hypothetical protein